MPDKKTLTVVQTGSPIGRRSDQEATLKGLGLNKRLGCAKVMANVGDSKVLEMALNMGWVRPEIIDERGVEEADLSAFEVLGEGAA